MSKRRGVCVRVEIRHREICRNPATIKLVCNRQMAGLVISSRMITFRKLLGDTSDPGPEWREVKEDLGRFVAPEGLEDSAQGFNPGNRPPGDAP